MENYVCLFSEDNASMKNLLGDKCVRLAKITLLGLPIYQDGTIFLTSSAISIKNTP